MPPGINGHSLNLRQSKMETETLDFCVTVGNKLMNHVTPRGMVQAVGEELAIFMYHRAINGCWDIPNLCG